MAEQSDPSADIPVLTDIVIEAAEPPPDTQLPDDIETLIAELQTTLAARTFALTEQALHSAFSEMEATLFEQISSKLRQELPELIDSVLRHHLGAEGDE